MNKPKEPQYEVQFTSLTEKGNVRLGPTTSHLWRSDPRHLVFYLSRYKFVAKMLADCKTVLEAGCGDSFGSTLLVQNGAHVHCTDFDPLFIDEAIAREGEGGPKSFEVVDFLKGKPDRTFDAAFSLDVIEHIAPADEDRFVENVKACVRDRGKVIWGTPSLESQVHASEWSKAGHVNCKSGKEWHAFFARHFTSVFLFGMNDEVVHTGFPPMCHYLFLVCVK